MAPGRELVAEAKDQVRVIYEDDEMVVVDKPASLVVNRAESVKGRSFQDWMEEHYGQVFEEADDELFKARSGMVHRLDKDTSGVMVAAKSPETMKELMRQFKEREVQKWYLALVHGKLEPGEGWMRVPMARSRGDRRKFEVTLGGKMTETRYKVVEYGGTDKSETQGYSLVELEPKTGRTHQIRVVVKHLGHPIVGDRLYLSKKRLRRDLGMCGRQFLHAKRLCVKHPVKQKRVCYKSELRDDLQMVLVSLGMESK